MSPWSAMMPLTSSMHISMRTEIQPGLLAIHGNRSEQLADAVLAWLQRHPLAPLEEEVILVQSAGMAEWLKMTLAQAGGVCAAMRVELPARFLWRTYRQVLGRDAVPSQCATDKAAMTWRLMSLLPSLIQQEGFEPVAGFLVGDEPDRLFQLASRLADLFDQYQVYRPDWLDAWAQGDDVLLNPGRPSVPLAGDQRWQPMLWRAIVATLTPQEMASIRPKVHQQVLQALSAGGATVSPVARRVVVFGMTSIPLTTLQLLAALGERSQVLMAVPNPCRYHWADIMDGRELLRGIARRRHGWKNGVNLAALPLDHMHAHAHPLLASWGRQSRDFVRQLDEFDDVQVAQARFALPRVDLFDEGEQDEGPLLTQVQQRIRDLVPMNEHAPVCVPDADRSIVFHVAHSLLREVEVLHDQLLQLFANTAGRVDAVQPRDVVVMVPDIDQAAPAIRAVFGQYGRHDPRFIPFDIADLSARASSPLVVALEWLLRLPTQRCRFSELRDLLDVPAIAAHFGVSEDALPRLTQWMAGAGIRWGLDETHRAHLGLAACGAQNTSWFGLHRMLLGYAAGAGQFEGMEAYDEIGGLEAELVGSLASLLSRLSRWNEVLSAPATPTVWAERGRALLADMVSPQDDADRLILSALDDALRVWLDACGQAGFDEPVPLPVAREAWLSALNEPTVNKRFKAGGVTFCTLMPMRAIPFEVVCLLGMNDGDYPRRATRTDFDLMMQAGTNRPGDRSRRDDDRQLMLEALLSARRVLYVSWTGRSVRDNSEQPPSVLVSQLRDYLASGWGEGVVANRTTEHPLQPFSRRYFEQGSPLITHAREWRAAHGGDEGGETAAAVPALPAYEPDLHVPLTLGQLAQFMRHPVQVFFRQRLNVVFDAPEAEPEDEESFGVAGLEEHQLVAQLTDEVLADLTNADASEDLVAQLDERLARLARAGRLPMGALGVWTRQALAQTVLPLLRAWRQQLAAYPYRTQRRLVQLAGHGLVVQDWLDQLRCANESDANAVWLELSASKLTKGKATKKGPPPPRLDKLRLAWLRMIAAVNSQVPVHGILVGSDATLVCEPMSGEQAGEALDVILRLWREGMNAPLPLPMRTAVACVLEEDAEAAYEGGYRVQADAADACWARVFPDFEALVADERFDSLAHDLWGRVNAWAKNHVTVILHEEAA